jgi:hypothetical protein
MRAVCDYLQKSWVQHRNPEIFAGTCPIKNEKFSVMACQYHAGLLFARANLDV